MFGHRHLQRVEAGGHDSPGEITAFERLHPHELPGATARTGEEGGKPEQEGGEFHGMKSSEKALLATYSHRLHSKNRKKWDRWKKYSIDKQIEIARTGLGGKP